MSWLSGKCGLGFAVDSGHLNPYILAPLPSIPCSGVVLLFPLWFYSFKTALWVGEETVCVLL